MIEFIIDIITKNFYYSFFNLNTFIGFWTPFFISILLLFFDIKKRKKFFSYSIFCIFILNLLLNGFSAKLTYENGYLSLSFIDLSLFFLLFILFFHKNISVFFPFYYCFFINFINDIIFSPNKYDEFLFNIGGAGLFDGLLIHPFITFITFYLFNFIRLKTNKKTIFN